MKRKTFLITLVVFGVILILSLISFFFLNKFVPDYETEEFTITIRGYIKTSDDFVDTNLKPSRVEIYPSYYSTNNLCQKPDLQYARIEWDNNTNIGKYSITASFQVEQEIIIIAECHSCYHNKSYVSKDNRFYEVNLTWDTSNCRQDRTNFKNSKDARDRAIRLLDRGDRALSDEDFNLSIHENIKNEINLGRGEIEDSSRSTEENGTLFHALYAIYFADKAYYKITGHQLKRCITDTERLLGEHSNTCFIPSSLGFKGYKAANNTLNSFMNSLDFYDRDRTFGESDRDNLENAIDRLYRDEDRINDGKGLCEDSLKMLKESFNHQENYCKVKKVSTNLAIISLVLIVLLLGVLIGKAGRRWGKICLYSSRGSICKKIESRMFLYGVSHIESSGSLRINIFF